MTTMRDSLRPPPLAKGPAMTAILKDHVLAGLMALLAVVSWGAVLYLYGR